MRHRRIPGASYGRADYEAIVPFVLERVRLGATDISETIARYQDGREPEPDRHALARIAQQRDRAATAFVRDRDVAALQATMTRLDDEERQAKASTRRAEPLPPAELRRYLEDLPAWWAAVGENDRRALAEALFARIRVLGVRRAIIEPTSEAVDRGIPEAFGLDEVEMVGARGFEPPTSSSRTMRAAKLRHAPTEARRGPAVIIA